MATYLLVHGAWHGAWCWRKVIPLLQAKGHTVLAPDLPGHGEDKTPATAVTLKSYTDRVCELANSQSEPVILAGHSMGGSVITQTAEDCPGRIRALVYVCAFVPRNGESLLTWASQDRESMVNPRTMEPHGEGVFRFKPQFIREAFYANCTDEEIAFATARLCDQSAAPFGTPVATTPERWGQIPRFYIECLRDRAITIELQRAMQEASPCQQTFSIDTDHSPFFSTPEKLADILDQIGTANARL